VDFHLDRKLRLHTDPEHKALYNWAINEIDAQGRQIGSDQIPWHWTLNFTATSCVLGDSFDIESQFSHAAATWIISAHAGKAVLRRTRLSKRNSQ
jgi:hypothetical protein